jgi:hypothetical protein
MDIGFGDIIHPAPEKSELPSILEVAAPRLLCYGRESTIAKKFEDVVMKVKEFIDPIASSLTSRKPPPLKLFAPGPWV